MKKLITIFTTILFATITANAQIIRNDELEEYSKEKYGENWVDAASNIAKNIQLDKNNAITFVQVIPAEGKTKEQLYVLLNYWFTATFNDANSAINLNDKNLGTIVGQGYVSNIARHTGVFNLYIVSVKPIIKCDIKDERIRITHTISSYDVSILDGAGQVKRTEEWTPDRCFPFVTKDSHKRASSKALVMSYAYSNVILDKIEECIKNGLTGNEDDDW